MPKGYEFNLKAYKYSDGKNTFYRPFKLILPKDHPKIAFFMKNPAFSHKEVYIVENHVPPVEEKISGHPLKDVPGISKNVLKSLKQAGVRSVEDVLSDDLPFEDLLKIPGIGEQTANKLIELCEAAIKEE